MYFRAAALYFEEAFVMEEIINVTLILISGPPSRQGLGDPHNLLVYLYS